MSLLPCFWFLVDCVLQFWNQIFIYLTDVVNFFKVIRRLSNFRLFLLFQLDAWCICLWLGLQLLYCFGWNLRDRSLMLKLPLKIHPNVPVALSNWVLSLETQSSFWVSHVCLLGLNFEYILWSLQSIGKLRTWLLKAVITWLKDVVSWLIMSWTRFFQVSVVSGQVFFKYLQIFKTRDIVHTFGCAQPLCWPRLDHSLFVTDHGDVDFLFGLDNLLMRAIELLRRATFVQSHLVLVGPEALRIVETLGWW